jgi:hypothetical protein
MRPPRSDVRPAFSGFTRYKGFASAEFQKFLAYRWPRSTFTEREEPGPGTGPSSV